MNYTEDISYKLNEYLSKEDGCEKKFINFLIINNYIKETINKGINRDIAIQYKECIVDEDIYINISRIDKENILDLDFSDITLIQ